MKIKNVEEIFTREDIEIAREVTSTYDCGMSRIALRAPSQRYLLAHLKNQSAVLDQSILGRLNLNILYKSG